MPIADWNAINGLGVQRRVTRPTLRIAGTAAWRLRLQSCATQLRIFQTNAKLPASLITG